MLENVIAIVKDFLNLLFQRNGIYLFVLMLCIVLVLSIHIIKSHESNKIVFLLILIFFFLIPFSFSFYYRSGINQYCELSLILDFVTEEDYIQDDVKIGRICLKDIRNETFIIISGVDYPEKTKLQIEGSLRSIKGLTPCEISLTKQIHTISLEKSTEIKEQISRGEGKYFVLPDWRPKDSSKAVNVPSIIINLPERIYFEGDFGLYVSFDSSASIREVEITFAKHLPVYTGDGELNGLTSILYRSIPVDNFRRFIWLRRISLNYTILIAVFSMMLGSWFFVLSVLRRNSRTLRNDQERIRELWNELDEII